MPRSLPRNQYAMLRYLSDSNGARLVSEIAEGTGVDQSLIAAAALELAEEQIVELVENPFAELTLLDAGQAQVDSGEVFPEFQIRQILDENGPLALPEIAGKLGGNPAEVGKLLRFIFSKKLAVKDKDTGRLTPTPGDPPDASLFDDVEIMERFRKGSDRTIRFTADESKSRGKALGELKSREFIKVRSRMERSVALTSAGRETLAAGIEEKVERNQLDQELLVDGRWRGVTFRPYDVTADTAPAYPAKPHPLRRILEETRAAFHFMGFEEVRGPYVESAFWDFDALFQPQDHPAREMQDTFYLNRPDRFDLPETDFVNKVRAVHENGGETGSLGWGYRWSEKEASRTVLRTHTTAATITALRENPNPPRKVFLVGRVFRREKTDYKHLPEFHQVDGIIVDKKASLSSLLGTLARFYKLMGFESVKFRPAFFPYTEPSVEVFVRMPGRETDWFELGGSGVFRPEVTRPCGCDVPVLAWGLGLERLAMARYGLTDIRKLYMSDFRWLEETPLCL